VDYSLNIRQAIKVRRHFAVNVSRIQNISVYAASNYTLITTSPSFVTVAMEARIDSLMLELQHADALVLKVPMSVSPTWLAVLNHADVG